MVVVDQLPGRSVPVGTDRQTDPPTNQANLSHFQIQLQRWNRWQKNKKRGKKKRKEREMPKIKRFSSEMEKGKKLLCFFGSGSVGQGRKKRGR